MRAAQVRTGRAMQFVEATLAQRALVQQRLTGERSYGHPVLLGLRHAVARMSSAELVAYRPVLATIARTLRSDARGGALPRHVLRLADTAAGR